MKPPEKRKKTAPIITHSFASPRVWPGAMWKIYLNASHPAGEMEAIYCTVHQPGTGTYPVSIIRLRDDQRRDFSGYLHLNTAGLSGAALLNLELSVQIQDRAGNFSEPAVFDLCVEPRADEGVPPPGFFEERAIGAVIVDLKPGPTGS